VVLLVGVVACLVAPARSAWAQVEASTAPQEASDCEPGVATNVAAPRFEPDDGRRTLGRLPANFGRGIIGVFSRDNLVPFLAGASATGLAALIDDGYTQPGSDNGFNDFGHGLGNPVIVGSAAIGLLAAGRFVHASKFRNMSYDLFLATSVNVLYTTGLKMAIARTRPDGSNDDSFPSGHTSNAFAWATVVDKHYGWQLGVPMYALAGLVGVTRVDRGSHFFTDVVAGAALGFIIGRTIVRQDSKPLDGPQVAVTPIVGPSGQRGLSVRIVY
jgi:membrane-associated phospholipid phosphatase